MLTFPGRGTYDHRLVAPDTNLADMADMTIAMASLAEQFRHSQARHSLLVLDCCFNGGVPGQSN